jgi:hypothetical protein
VRQYILGRVCMDKGETMCVICPFPLELFPVKEVIILDVVSDSLLATTGSGSI